MERITQLYVLNHSTDATAFFQATDIAINRRQVTFLGQLFSVLAFPLSIVVEYSYVDRVYRDSYYEYFSSKHFDISRMCIRLSLFTDEMELQDFKTIEGQQKLQQSVIGFVVLRPISPGDIGRVLLNPFKLKGFDGYVRTASFSFEVHYYVESGIPIGVAVKAEYNSQPVYHSIVCIGHGKIENSIATPTVINGISFIDSADYYNKYVVMDDNNIPYEIKEYNQFTQYNNPEVQGFVVPLYKRIFLEARDAYSIIEKVLTSAYSININDLVFEQHAYCPKDNPIVVRLFLTSSRHYIKYRSTNCLNDYMFGVYTNVPMPRFIWVAELSLKSLYDEEMIFGEIVLDATAAKLSALESLVMVHYPHNLGFRMRSESMYDLFKRLSVDDRRVFGKYSVYVNNLNNKTVWR